MSATQPPTNQKMSPASEQATSMPNTTQTPSEPNGFKDKVDTINKLAQIFALAIAGIWAWSVFQQTVRPGLEAKSPVDTELHWASIPNSNVCQVRFEIKITNEGQVPFDINDVRVNGWIVDLEEENLPEDSASSPTFFNPAVLAIGGNRLWDGKCNDLPPKDARIAPFDTGDDNSIRDDLIDHFPPGAKTTASSTYFFRRREKAIVVLRADVKGDLLPFSLVPFRHRQKCFTNYSYAVDQICGGKWDANLREKGSSDEGTLKVRAKPPRQQ